MSAPLTKRFSPWRVTVQGSDTSFEVRRNDLLLRSALAQGIAYPHNCRVGTCGRCKTRLVDGHVTPLVDFALSPLTHEELKQGYILACQAQVRSDLCIDVELDQRALPPQRTIASHVVGWRRLGGDVLDLRLRLDEPLMFSAGQYASIAPSGSFVRRSYSFYDAPPAADGPGADGVGFLIKRLPGGQLSEWLFAEDRRGCKIWLEGPFGQMGVDVEQDRDALCVAGGTGLAPILSIVADRLKRTTKAIFTIVFGVRGKADLFATDRLRQLQERAPGRVQVLPILSDEPASSSWQGRRGLVTEALTSELCSDYSQVDAFVCGRTPMVEAVESRLKDLGVAATRIHTDKFQPTGV